MPPLISAFDQGHTQLRFTVGFVVERFTRSMSNGFVSMGWQRNSLSTLTADWCQEAAEVITFLSRKCRKSAARDLNLLLNFKL